MVYLTFFFILFIFSFSEYSLFQSSDFSLSCFLNNLTDDFIILISLLDNYFLRLSFYLIFSKLWICLYLRMKFGGLLILISSPSYLEWFHIFILYILCAQITCFIIDRKGLIYWLSLRRSKRVKALLSEMEIFLSYLVILFTFLLDHNLFLFMRFLF